MKKLSLCFLLLCSFLQAQVVLEVQVINEDHGTDVAGLKVHLSNPNTGFQADAVSNQQGTARFIGLSTSGRYRVFLAENQHWQTTYIEDLRLRANFTNSVKLYIYASETLLETQAISVKQVTQINSSDAEGSSTLRELQTLTIEGRDLTRTLFRLPNVTQATGFYPEAPNVSINGANSLFTNYMIDGMDNNENFLGGQKFAVPVGFAKSVTVLTNNYSSEFGRTGNGIFNVTSKSGSNELKGEVFTIFRPGAAWDANSALAQRDLSGNQVKGGFKRRQAGFAVGGPIIDDHIFYFVDVETTRDDKDNLLHSPSLGILETVPGKNRFE